MSPLLTKHATKPGILLFWVFILMLAGFLNGCRERLLPRTTAGMDSEPAFWVRVLLFDDIKLCTLRLPSSFAVTTGETNTILYYFEQTSLPINITISQGNITVAEQSFSDKEITIRPDRPFVFAINSMLYRGNLTFRVNDNRTSFDAINIVPLEAYLRGVVGAEMPSYWEPQALQAQAIAGRTYCLYIKKHFGINRHWDVRRTQANQVYLGVAAESQQVDAAVNSTIGQVLICTHDDGTRDIFPTYYCSTCGGHTENSKNVFGDSFAPLCGVPCPYCKDVAKPGFFFWPMVQFDKTYVTRQIVKKYPKLKGLGKITAIKPAAESKYEQFTRMTSVKLTGTNGKSGYLRGEDFRLTLDPTGEKLRSTAFKITDLGTKWAFFSGRGYGHAVGMCQTGAQAMARQGKNAYEILTYYYPGSEIARIY